MELWKDVSPSNAWFRTDPTPQRHIQHNPDEDAWFQLPAHIWVLPQLAWMLLTPTFKNHRWWEKKEGGSKQTTLIWMAVLGKISWLAHSAAASTRVSSFGLLTGDCLNDDIKNTINGVIYSKCVVNIKSNRTRQEYPQTLQTQTTKALKRWITSGTFLYQSCNSSRTQAHKYVRLNT